jgi:hypothetical protein
MLGHRIPDTSDPVDDPVELLATDPVGLGGTSVPQETAESIVLVRQSEQTSTGCLHRSVGGDSRKKSGSPLHITHSSQGSAALQPRGMRFLFNRREDMPPP